MKLTGRCMKPPPPRLTIMSEAERVAQVARGLIDMERERLTGWQGPGGAAYNVISEDLCEQGLLRADWSLSPFGLLVKAHLEKTDAS